MKRILIFLLIFFLSAFSLFSSALRVYYINVGQGDCIYISFPDGRNMLIDGGPDEVESISNPVINFLKAKEITKINYMLASHPHADHIEGLYAVLRMFNVEKVYDTGVDNPDITIDNSLRELAKKVPGRYKIVNSTGALPDFSVSSASCTVLYTNTAPQANLNNNSIVIKIQYLNSTFLFGGDATGKTVEAKLVELHGAGIKSDFYKVHHHGSKYSSYDDATTGVAFLNNLQPKYAVIQVGKNSYGHPSPEAIVRISKFTGHGNIYRNDLHGTIFVRTTGDGGYSIQTGYIPVPDAQEPQPGQPPQPGAPAPLVKSDFIIAETRDNIFNPEKGAMYLAYTMTEPGEIQVNIYTLFGELIKEYRYRENRVGSIVESDWSWDGRNEKGQIVAPGVYLIHIQTPLKTVIKKAVIIR